MLDQVLRVAPVEALVLDRERLGHMVLNEVAILLDAIYPSRLGPLALAVVQGPVVAVKPVAPHGRAAAALKAAHTDLRERRPAHRQLDVERHERREGLLDRPRGGRRGAVVHAGMPSASRSAGTKRRMVVSSSSLSIRSRSFAFGNCRSPPSHAFGPVFLRSRSSWERVM